MNAVLCQGGLCTTKAGLDQLYKNGKAENLKDQIRYRKLVMGQEDLRLTGTTANLYQTLLGKICNEPSLKEGCSLGKRQSFKIKVLMMIIKYNAVTVKINLTETVA